jgi:ferrous iron transport protein A
MKTLDQSRPGDRLCIERVDGSPELVQRLLEFGLLEGEIIEVVGIAPLGDPLEIHIGGTRLSLRKREASCIAVTQLPTP